MGVCAYNLNEMARFSLSIPIEFYLQNEVREEIQEVLTPNQQD